jgi:two-component system, chemotaxis family, sensor kinase CheA
VSLWLNELKKRKQTLTTSQSGNNPFFAGFLDDYFAECDEHLTAVRRGLLALESFLGQSKIDRSLLDDLFRRFHSLKGISGMVGLYEAEQLAHQLESYLRLLRQDQITLEQEGMDALIDGVKVLEQVIVARRSDLSPPNISSIMSRLGEVISIPASTGPRIQSLPAGSVQDSFSTFALNGDEIARIESALQAGARIWHISFIPGAELTERGINVNSIRSRLMEVGDLIRAIPRVTAQGGIAFDFLISSRADESLFVGWLNDGITYKSLYSSLEDLESQNSATLSETSTISLPALSPSNVVRVDLERLNELMRMVGELVISRSHLEENLGRLETLIPTNEWEILQETNQAMERQLRELREGVMQVRMVPIGEIFERMQFVIRDLRRESQKRIRLELSGQETEIDKYLVERMMDPLLHLVRNAVSHGLEPESERLLKGKPPEGRISLRASTAAEMVVIEVEDDGRGIDWERVAARGRSLGLIGPDTPINEETILGLICSSGFSTKDEADRASGRGIGMAVVKNTILEMGGSISLDSRPGEGTRFTINLPLTLAIAEALIVSVGGQSFTVPQSSVSEVLEIDPASVTVLENNEIISYRDSILPIMRLSRFFGLPESKERNLYAFVSGSGLNSLGIVVDHIMEQREIVVRPITDPLIHVTGIGGATELGDGRPVLILDTAALIRTTSRQPGVSNRKLSGQNHDHSSRNDLIKISQSQNVLPVKRRNNDMPESINASDSFILFEVAGTTYGLRSTVVQQMEMIEHITPVPNAPSFVEGVVFSRGKVIPALNLRVRFGFEKIKYDLRTRLIIVNSGDHSVGFIVDSSREFVTIESDAVQPLNESISGLSGDYLEGIARLGDRLILILNLRGVTDFSEKSLQLPTGAELMRIAGQKLKENE